MVVDLGELLRKIFVLKGVDVLDREPYDYIWVKNNGELELIYVEGREKVDGEYVLSFNRDTEQIHASKTIICVSGYTDDAKNIADKLNIELLDRTEFAHVLGEFIIEIYEKDNLDELDILGEEDVEVEELETEEDEDTIPIFLEDVGDNGEEKIIKPSLSEDEVENIGRNYVHGFSKELILIPYFLYEYTLELVIEGTMQSRNVNGVLAINGVNKKYELWKGGYETTTQLEIVHRRLEPKIGVDDAKTMIKKMLEEEYSREEEVKIEGENVTIIEKKKIRPKKGSIKTKYMGMYYFPVWVVQGKNGIIMINGVTGETIKEKIY